MRRLLALLLLGSVAFWAQERKEPEDEEEGEEEGIDRPLDRWLYFYDQRRFPAPFIPEGARLKGFRELQNIDRIRRTSRAAAIEGQWRLVGPRPVSFNPGYAVSGRITSLAVDPRNNDVVYIGGADGGVWKTTDGGASWTPLTDDQPSIAIGALALDPQNPDVVYAGTGEANFNSDAYTGLGILKSTDGGATWTNIVGPFSRQRFGALAVHPRNGNILLAATVAGIYRSTDAGVTWTNTMAGTATAVFFDRDQPAIVWAALGNINGSTLNGVYRSADGGLTWARITGGGTLPSGTTVGRIEVVPGPGDSLYAALAGRTVSGSSLLGVYRSTNGGEQWTRLNTPDFCNPQCWFDLALRPHPSDPNIVFAGGVGMVRTLNGGSTWQVLPNNGVQGAPHVDHHAMVFTNDGTRFFDGNDGGVWSSETFDAGPIVWNNLNATLAITQYYPSVSMHPTDPSITLAGSQDNGTHLYQGNVRWTRVISGDGGWTAIDPSSPNIAYGAYVYADIFRTNRLDFGDIVTINHGIDAADRIRFIAPYVMDPTNPQRLYFGTHRLYRSLDGGGLWRPISPDLTNPPSGNTSSTAFAISTIAVAPSDGQVIYTGSASGAFYASQDGGANWEDRGAGLPTRALTKVTVDPLDPAKVYVTVSGFGPSHVFRSLDFGRGWTNISGNLPDVPVNDLAIDLDLPDTIFLGTDLGVMVSYDDGGSWETLGTGLPRSAVASLILHRPSRTLRAATHGRSVWDLSLPAGSGFRPVISSLNPTSRNAGAGAFTLTVNGTNLGPGTKVLWNGTERSVTASTSTQLQVAIPASDLAGSGRAAVTVFNPARGGGSSIPARFTIGPAPTISQGGVVSAAATTVPTAAPGSLISIYGEGFTAGLSQAIEFPMPRTLGGVTVTVGTRAAPIYFVSPNQINVQVPYETATTRPTTVTIDQGGLAGSPVSVNIARTAPSLFSLNQQGTGQGAIRIGNSALVAAPTGSIPGARAARKGEVIEIYCTGLGAVSPTSATGNAASGRSLSNTLLRPVVSIGGVPATVLFSGLTPGVAGLYQVNVQIPESAPSSPAVPVVLTMDGVTSNTVTVAVE